MSKKTCELIIDGGNDYVIAVKSNQPSLHNHIQNVADIFRQNGYDSVTTHQRFLSHDIEKLLHLVE